MVLRPARVTVALSQWRRSWRCDWDFLKVILIEHVIFMVIFMVITMVIIIFMVRLGWWISSGSLVQNDDSLTTRFCFGSHLADNVERPGGQCHLCPECGGAEGVEPVTFQGATLLVISDNPWSSVINSDHLLWHQMASVHVITWDHFF